ncbi:MAG TPA: hypothetical protein VEB21_00315 [Terriglobales bacterium]|nr:hypothetical protein [Terriglobales bacterium]
MQHEQLSPITQGLIWLLIAAWAMTAVGNIVAGEVGYPAALVIVLIGFAMFLRAKLSVIRVEPWINFGSRRMEPNMRDLYRVGYWLMIVGTLTTFAPH